MSAALADWALVEPLYLEHADAAFAAAASILGSAQDAEDILQDATVKAACKIHTLRDPGRARGWYLAIVGKQALDRWRQRHRQRQAEAPLDDRTEQTWQVAVLPVDRYPELRLALDFIDTLPDRQRVAYLLCHYFGLDRESIADILGCEPATVSVHLFRARAKVNREFRWR
nr:sigma-70 family RNA polymerase sigma factor [Amycolatopsis anabasis]